MKFESPKLTNLDVTDWTEWKASTACKLSASTCTPNKALLVSKSFKEARFQLYCVYSWEVWWMCKGRSSSNSSFRTSQQKLHYRTLKRLCLHEFLHTCKCIIEFIPLPYKVLIIVVFIKTSYNLNIT